MSTHDSVCEQCGDAHSTQTSDAQDEEMFCSIECELLYNALKA